MEEIPDDNSQNKNRIEHSSLNAGRDIQIGDTHHHLSQQVVVPPVIIKQQAGNNLFLLLMVLLLSISIIGLGYYIFIFKVKGDIELKTDGITSTSGTDVSDPHQDRGNQPHKSSTLIPVKPNTGTVATASSSKTTPITEDNSEKLIAFMIGATALVKGNETVKTFRLNQYEVTIGQYLGFCRKSGKKFPSDKLDSTQSKYPVRYISWDDANAYCEFVGGRLPTSTEWELAASQLLGDATGLTEGKLQDIAWYRFNSGGIPHPVGQKKTIGSVPLYDLFGNVDEWCADGPKDGLKYVAGGFYYGLPQDISLKVKTSNRAAYPNETVGFRVAY